MKKVKVFIVTLFVLFLTAIILTSCNPSKRTMCEHVRSSYGGYR